MLAGFGGKWGAAGPPWVQVLCFCRWERRALADVRQDTGVSQAQGCVLGGFLDYLELTLGWPARLSPSHIQGDRGSEKLDVPPRPPSLGAAGPGGAREVLFPLHCAALGLGTAAVLASSLFSLQRTHRGA